MEHGQTVKKNEKKNTNTNTKMKITTYKGLMKLISNKCAGVHAGQRTKKKTNR